MIELERHIEVLLLDNDCVIVPGFGGFVAHHVTARYETDERLFLPPLRTLGFNPQLRINDSLLAQSYVDAYDISYPEAVRRIDKEVDELKRVLSEEGSYTMGSIGVLTVNDDGNYEFEPSEAGVCSPTLYGLSSYNFPLLKDKAKEMASKVQTAAQVAIDEPIEETTEEVAKPVLLDFTGNDDDDDRAIQIKMSWIRNTVAIAAAVVAFFLMVTPVANSDLNTQTMSKLHNNILYRLLPQDTNIAPVAEPVKEIPAAQSAKECAAQQAEVKKADAPTYYIVVASQVKKSNAEIFVEQLHKQGYKDAAIFIHNDIVRVTCGEFATESEAYRQLNKMNVHEQFYEAWVYKKKES